mgnify:FL=1
MDLYDRIVDKNLLIRRLTVAACRLTDERNAESKETYEQLDLFTDYSALQKKRQQEEMLFEKEKKMQKAVLNIQKRFGRNAVIKGMSLLEGATAKERNEQIGGHKA